MRRALGLALLLAALPGCRILSGEVACERDRDCPGAIRFCDAEEGEVGLCVEEDPFPEPDTDGGGGFPVRFDAGPGAEDPLDAGLDAG